jgi:hypothetical protein
MFSGEEVDGPMVQTIFALRIAPAYCLSDYSSGDKMIPVIPIVSIYLTGTYGT